MTEQFFIEFKTRGRGAVEITKDIEALIPKQCVNGLCHVFIQHTSASIMLCENSDPTVLKDLERFLEHMVMDGSRLFRHVDEGIDDMPAHVRSVLTHSDLTIPFSNGKLLLGRWQGIFLYEHRLSPHVRKLVITILSS
jgi:secondary thiamine-phosphate synthase enzyme